MKIFFASLLLAFSPTTIHGFPKRAGHCKSGPLGDNLPYAAHGSSGSGALEDGDYSIEIGSTTLTNGGSIDITAGEDLTMSLAGDGVTFRGFLIRLSGSGGTDASSSLSVTDTSNSQDLTEVSSISCADDISAVTHTNNNDKSSVSVGFNHASESTLTLEVTVVKKNKAESRDAWYYSSYTINVGSDGGGSPTPAPSSGGPCLDAEGKVEITIGSKTKSKPCSFWAKPKKGWCDSVPAVRAACPESCNACPTGPTEAPSPAPTPSGGGDCPDTEPEKNPKFFWDVKIKNGKEKPKGKPCSWLAKKGTSSQNKYCSMTEGFKSMAPAKDVCVRTCCLLGY